jgi:hypothetical protein
MAGFLLSITVKSYYQNFFGADLTTVKITIRIPGSYQRTNPAVFDGATGGAK